MRKLLCFLLVLLLVLGLTASVTAAPSKEFITTTATGYDSADDVVYVTYSQSGKTVIANWGARGEECVFLSTYAEDYYTGDYIWDIMSELTGGTSTSNAPSSNLYIELQELMEGTHTFYTYYDGNKNVRDYYRYTDCVSSHITQVALIYRGGLVSSTWDSGKTWNQEHCWPKSKLSTDKQIGDIMHLRPANPSENSSRGNKAYGEGSGYYDPGVSVRGDCARMMLYIYVRWGVTGTMWGSSGVMESLDILLKWMEEDPVDTWEMGRNDAVQSVTGVRNVFVDYPEYAWLLFGKEVPEDLVTPSGEAMGGEEDPICTHSNTQVRNKQDATCGEDGYSGDTYCRDCGELLSGGSKISATGEHTMVDGAIVPGGGYMDRYCQVCGYSEMVELPPCEHKNTQRYNAKEATCGTDGFTGTLVCEDCTRAIEEGETIPATGEHTLDETGHCTGCEYFECTHANMEHRNQSDATCGTDGHTGDVYCAVCGDFIAGGSVIPATGEHTFGQWSTSEDGATRTHRCTDCGFEETENLPPEPGPLPEPVSDNKWFYIAVAAVGLILICLIAIIIGKKKKRR